MNIEYLSKFFMAGKGTDASIVFIDDLRRTIEQPKRGRRDDGWVVVLDL
jgi:hypothetical protein